MDSTYPVTASPLPIPSADARPPADNLRTWVRKVVGGGQIVETCPEWCTWDHRSDFSGNLDDLTHGGIEVGTEVSVRDQWVDGEPVMLQLPVLVAQLRVDPYSENPKRNVPFVALELTDDTVLDELSPEDFARYIAQIRAHCDRLERLNTQLAEARAAHR